jgi:hypothetical protein
MRGLRALMVLDEASSLRRILGWRDAFGGRAPISQRVCTNGRRLPSRVPPAPIMAVIEGGV